MRKYISIFIAVLILVGAFFIARKFVQNKTKKKPQIAKIIKTVFTETVRNTEIPIIISTSGNLVAKNKIELYSEVQGVLRVSSKEFKAGTYYKKGETIISINNEEQKASLLSLKSNLFNALTGIMPDIRIDYPEEYEKWKAYLSRFDMNKPVESLPETKTDKEKFFISSRNIYTSYYSYKNIETRLNKYRLSAPYSGVLTEAIVSSGSLVRAGQKLGEFINTSVYELEVAVNIAFNHLLKIGNKVELSNLEGDKNWTGTVRRVNGKADQATQTIKVYIQVSGKGLHDGMYLAASLKAKSESNAYELPRNLLVNNNSLFVLKDTLLDLVKIDAVYFNKENVVVKGLADGTQVLIKPIPGAYIGMPVKQYKMN
ncbi:MAG: HlyD family efflux transporter periplasmic adaptor subunit [Bacteroidales bacterium]|nr:HlyD family efflux transporter periplasmic adaptor subunit [Bacteroidales bacterium]